MNEISEAKAIRLIYRAGIANFDHCEYQHEAEGVLDDLLYEDSSLRACLMDKESTFPSVTFDRSLFESWIKSQAS